VDADVTVTVTVTVTVMQGESPHGFDNVGTRLRATTIQHSHRHRHSTTDWLYDESRLIGVTYGKHANHR
jgi:hypothetical protein